jgi:hypothetical protein
MHAARQSVPRASAVCAAVLGLACAPDPDGADDDGVVQTEHLRITTTTGNPICAGTPVLLERELQRIAMALELPLWSEEERLDVRLGEEAVAEVCAQLFDGTDGVAGCATNVDDALVVAAIEVSYTTPHELVHAIRGRNRTYSTISFEEGLAEILSASEGFPLQVSYPRGDPAIGPLELLEIPREDFHGGYYVWSQSFVSWLWETYGGSTLLAFVNDPAFDGADAALALFEQHFGLPLAEAEQTWRIDDRPDPVWGAPCIPDRTYSLADGPVELSGSFDCDDPTVYGASYNMSLWPMCLDVPETTRVRMSFEADHGRLQVLWREPCEPGPSSPEAGQDKTLQAGETREADMIGCRFRMLVKSDQPGFPATPYTIRIEELGG